MEDFRPDGLPTGDKFTPQEVGSHWFSHKSICGTQQTFRGVPLYSTFIKTKSLTSLFSRVMSVEMHLCSGEVTLTQA